MVKYSQEYLTCTPDSELCVHGREVQVAMFRRSRSGFFVLACRNSYASSCSFVQYKPYFLFHCRANADGTNRRSTHSDERCFRRRQNTFRAGGVSVRVVARSHHARPARILQYPKSRTVPKGHKTRVKTKPLPCPKQACAPAYPETLTPYLFNVAQLMRFCIDPNQQQRYPQRIP